ncbi:hypothetical protein B0H66DRAFT_564695 [Apodospora peruviana]|uniref:GYF domain-containing protein n=1 Tax=Apodospora peruviana TaxID=516989 RepID=A0AAE0M121_9PEZI|nr:hypothetical protein B0H66DRAFT_564695 [Apodospora peruviana]
MSSRFSAARPRRAGEVFARAHHGEDAADSDEAGGSSSRRNKKVKFDVRNPSALAPSAQDDEEDDDQVLAADVIGASTRAIKRGAVNVDGYDSDSDNENFNARAETRVKKGREAEDVDLAEVMDNYASKGQAATAMDEDEDDEVDMFGGADEDNNEGDKAAKAKLGKKAKEVRFLEKDQIEGEEYQSKSGGVVRLDDNDDGASDDDDDEGVDIEAVIEEEGLDEEVGAGGLKKHAPKIDAFNMKSEQEEGAFDEAGNFIRKTADANDVHDRWLEGLSKKDIKKAAAAREKREEELRQQQRENDSILTSDLLKTLILRLEIGETALEALARLGKGLTKPKKVPKWKQKKLDKKSAAAAAPTDANAMDVDAAEKEPEDPKQTKIKNAIDEVTDAADKLLKRDYRDIYDTERERLIREYGKQTGEDWLEPPAHEEGEPESAGAAKTWEFRWVDGRDDAAKQGPFDGPTMKAWQDAGYFGEGVEFRPAGVESGWTTTATFV